VYTEGKILEVRPAAGVVRQVYRYEGQEGRTRNAISKQGRVESKQVTTMTGEQGVRSGQGSRRQGAGAGGRHPRTAGDRGALPRSLTLCMMVSRTGRSWVILPSNLCKHGAYRQHSRATDGLQAATGGRSPSPATPMVGREGRAEELIAKSTSRKSRRGSSRWESRSWQLREFGATVTGLQLAEHLGGRGCPCRTSLNWSLEKTFSGRDRSL
jgi:hypothetical protein